MAELFFGVGVMRNWQLCAWINLGFVDEVLAMIGENFCNFL